MEYISHSSVRSVSGHICELLVIIELGIWHTFRTVRTLDLLELARAANL
jgi:hypothetical protein